MRGSLLAIYLFGFFLPLLGQISIIATSLPSGSLGQVYSAQLISSNAAQTLQWSIETKSGNLPPGLSLYSSGIIGGTPTAAGTYSFIVSAQDNAGATGQQQFSITIAAIAVTTVYLPTSVWGDAYSTHLAATGGSGGPYQWTFSSNGSAAARAGEFALNGDGTISGMPVLPNELYRFEATAFDPITQQESLPQSFTLIVTACLLGLPSTTIPNAEV